MKSIVRSFFILLTLSGSITAQAPAAAAEQKAIAAWDAQAIKDAATADTQAQQVANTGDMDVAVPTSADIASSVGDMPDDLSDLDKMFPPTEKYLMVEDFPIIGKIGFNQDEQGNMVAEFADENRKFTVGPLTFDYAQFLTKDDKLSLIARGELFGKQARIGFKDFDKSKMVLTLSVEFIAKPTIAIVPGLTARIDAVDITMGKGKTPTTFNVKTSIAGKQFIIQYTKVKKGVSDISAALPTIKLGEIITPASDTPVGDIALTNGKLEAKGVGKGPKAVYTITASADLSSLFGLETSEDELRGIKVEITMSQATGRTFTASLSGIKMADFGELKNAKVVASFPNKKPSTITFTGETVVSVPDLGDIDVKLKANLAGTKKGTAYTFVGDVAQNLSLADNQITVKNVHASYSPPVKKKAARWEFTGDATFFGVNATADIIKQGKITTAQLKLGQEFKPFSGLKALNIPAVPGLEGVSLKDPTVKISGKNLTLTGLMDIGFGAVRSTMEVIDAKGGKVVRITGNLAKENLPSELASAAGEMGLTNFKMVVLNKEYKEKKVTFKEGATIEADAKDISLPGGVTIKNAHALYSQADKKLALEGDVDLFGLTLQAALSRGPNGYVGNIGADLGTLVLDDWVKKMPGGMKDVFEQIEKIFTFNLNHVTVALNVGEAAPQLKISADGMDAGGAIGSVLNQIGLTSGLKPVISIPLAAPTDVDIKFKKAINVALANVVKLKDLDFDLVGGLPPKVKFDFDGSVNIPGAGERDVELAVDTTAPGAFSFYGSIKGDALNKPFGFPIQLTDPMLGVNFAGGVLAGLKVNGHFKLGDMDVEGYVDVNLGAPYKSAMDITITKMCLTDMMKWGVGAPYELGAMAVSKISGINLELPSTLICLTDSHGVWAILPVQKPNGQLIKPGLTLIGNVTFEFPGLPTVKAGKMEVTIDPLSGFKFDAHLDGPLKLGPIFQISAANDESKPPSVTGEISKDKQEFRINGLVNFAGIFKSLSDITISPSELKYKTEGIMFGVSSKVNMDVPTRSPQNAKFGLDLSAPDIQNLVRGPIMDGLNVAKREISAFADKANDALNDAEGKCGNIVVLSDICKSPMEIAKAAVTGFDQTIKGLTKAVDVLSDKVLGTFQMKGLAIAGSPSSVVPGGPPVHVAISLKVLGDDHEFGLDIPMPSPNQAGDFFKMIGNQIFDHAIKPAVDEIVHDAQQALDRAKDAINAIGDGATSAARAVQQAGEEVAHVAVQSANAVKDAGNAAINGIKDTTNTAVHGAVDAANTVASAAKTAVNTVGNAAQTAVNAVGDAAKSAVNAVSNFAQDTAQKAMSQINNVVNVLSSGWDTVKGGFESFGHALGF